MKIPKPLAHWATLATLRFTAAPFAAHAQDKKPVSPAEMNYQAGTSPLGEVPMDVLKRACTHGSHLASRVCSALGATTALPHTPPPPPVPKVSATHKRNR